MLSPICEQMQPEIKCTNSTPAISDIWISQQQQQQQLYHGSKQQSFLQRTTSQQRLCAKYTMISSLFTFAYKAIKKRLLISRPVT